MKAKRPTDARSVPGSDRRSGRDRRQADLTPPGGRERRRNVEPRQPEVVEIELTLSQWASLHDLPLPAAEPAEPPVTRHKPDA